jgi:hypothetical protein
MQNLDNFNFQIQESRRSLRDERRDERRWERKIRPMVNTIDNRLYRREMTLGYKGTEILMEEYDYDIDEIQNVLDDMYDEFREYKVSHRSQVRKEDWQFYQINIDRYLDNAPMSRCWSTALRPGTM